MRLLISGDPHLKISSLETGKRFLDFFLKTIGHTKPDGIVILGDLFDTHAVMRVEVLNAWVSFLKQVKNQPIWLMVGNHDKASPASSEHALVGLDRFDQVFVADEPKVGSGWLGYLPYYHTFKEFEAAVNKLPSEVETLFCHNTFDGAQYENGFYDPNGFPLSSVARFKTVIAGHVHKAQALANVIYVGSPYQFSFQDAGEHKGLLLYDTDTQVWKKITTPLPQYHVLTYTSPDGFLENFEGEPRDVQDHFKIVVHGDKAALSMMATDERYLSLKGKYKLNVALEFKAEAPKRDSVVQRAATLPAMVETYISEVMETSLNKERLAGYARTMLDG